MHKLLQNNNQLLRATNVNCHEKTPKAERAHLSATVPPRASSFSISSLRAASLRLFW